MPDPEQVLDTLLRDDPGRLLSVVIRKVRDFDLAEDVLQEAAAQALVHWRRKGIPENPAGWLVTVAVNRSIDRHRKSRREQTKLSDYAAEVDSAVDPDVDKETPDIQDDRLRLIFTCCHPALAPEAQIALTLKTLGGLSTSEIAHAFLVPETTMAQRLVRAKGKIKRANIPYDVPPKDKLGERVEGVLSVLYLIFNEGYSAASGRQMVRTSLTSEAIRLVHLLRTLLPGDPEVAGLLALMLFHDARVGARVGVHGEMLLLDEQDRRLWDRTKIKRANEVLEQAIAHEKVGPFQVQAAIAGLHANAPSAAVTNWPQIAACYDQLYDLTPTPIVALNRVVAQAMAQGPDAGLALLEGVSGLDRYHLYHATRADLYRRTAQLEKSAAAYERALRCDLNEAERDFLTQRLTSVRHSLTG